MHGFRKGRQDCLKTIFERLYPDLYVYGFRMVGEEAVAEDFAEEALLVVWERRERFEVYLELRHFCYVTVRNACYSWLKKQKVRTAAVPALVALQNTEPTRLDDIIRAELHRELHEAIALLPAQAREVLKLSYLEGKTIKEVASILRMQPGTVKSHRNRALTLLRKRLSLLLSFLSIIFFE